MTKPRLLIGVAVVLVLLSIAVLGYVGVRMFGTREPGTPGQPFSPSGGTQGPGGSVSQTPNTTSIRTRSGETISVPDILSGHEPQSMDGGRFYTLYGPEYSTEGFSFSLQYSEKDSQFLVLLQTEPIGTARIEAQKYLGALLKLPDSELCTLNTVVLVTPDVSEVYSQYENLGISFCPNAVKLP